MSPQRTPRTLGDRGPGVVRPRRGDEGAVVSQLSLPPTSGLLRGPDDSSGGGSSFSERGDRIRRTRETAWWSDVSELQTGHRTGGTPGHPRRSKRSRRLLVVAMRRSRGLPAPPSRSDGRRYQLRSHGNRLAALRAFGEGVRSAPWRASSPETTKRPEGRNVGSFRLTQPRRAPHSLLPPARCSLLLSHALADLHNFETVMSRDVAPVLTVDRAIEISRGVGDPATEHELAQFAIWNARTASIWKKLKPQVVEVLSDLEASGYDKLPLGERRRYRHWTPKAFLLYRQQTPRRIFRPNVGRAVRGRRVRTSRTSRGAPARSDPPESDLPDLARHGGRVSLLGGRS